MKYTITHFTGKHLSEIEEEFNVTAKCPPPDVENGPSPDDLELTLFTEGGEEIGAFSVPADRGYVCASVADFWAYMNDPWDGYPENEIDMTEGAEWKVIGRPEEINQ